MLPSRSASLVRAAVTAALALSLSTPALAAEPPADPEAVAALCADRVDQERDVCAMFCTTWPATKACLFARRWGVRGLNTLVRVNQHGQSFEQAATEEGVSTAEAELLRLHADFGSFLPGPWATDPPLDAAHQAQADRARSALVAGMQAIGGGDHETALARFAEAASAYEAAYGTGYRLAGAALQNRGQVLGKLHRFDEAERELLHARTILRAAYPARHPYVAMNAIELGNLFQAKGDIAAAAEQFAAARETLSAVLGPDDPLVLTATNNLSTCLERLGRNGEIAPLQAAVVAARRIVSGPRSPETLTAEMNQAETFLSRGMPAEALARLRGILSRAEAVFGAQHPELGTILHNLGRAEAELGQLDRALAAETRAAKVLTSGGRAYARESATVLVGIGDIQLELGDVAAAVLVYGKALDVRLEILGPLHDDTGAVFGRLSQAMLLLGKTDDARRYAELSLAAAFQSHGPPAVVGRRRARYAAVLAATGDTEGAEAQYRGALKVLTDASGPEDPDLAAVEGSLGALLANRGALTEARPLLAHAAERLEATRGALAKSTVAASYLLSLIEARLGDRRAALKRAETVSSAGWERFERLVAEAPNPVAPRGALAELRAPVELHRDLLLASGDVAGAFDATLRVQGAGTRGELAWRAGHGGPPAPPVATRRGLCGALKRDKGALVLFTAATDLREEADEAAPKRAGAFVLTGARCTPKWVDLGAQRDIVTAVTAWRDGLDAVKACYLKRGDPAFCGKDLRRSDEAGGRLREVVWDPIARALGRLRRAWVVPNGPLTRVAFDALPGADGAYLLEGWELAYAMTPDALMARPGKQIASGALVVGDIDFEAAVADSGEATALWQRCAGSGCDSAGGIQVAGVDVAAARGGVAACGYDVRWPSLGTTEVGAVAASLGTRDKLGETWLVAGKAATEGALLTALAGKRVVHLATHGFFAPPDLCATTAVTAGGDVAGAREALLAEQLSGRGGAVIDPLRLSGVVVSGANAGQGGDRSPAADGLVSAREIAELDLRGTGLVALSACETGLGMVETGESFQGLVGAFLEAGAERAVVSLWQVPSDTTAELFERFYADYAKNAGATPWKTLREARLALVKTLADDGYPRSAFLWGAFIPVSGVAGGW